MHKISQKDLLSEGFWDKFTSVGRQVKDIAKTYGGVIAPEIVDPLKKGIDFLRSSRKSRKRAGMTKDELAWEQIVEDGYFPHSKKMRWKGKPNSDDTITGSVDVSELEHDDQTGEPIAGRPYQRDKSKYIFKFDPNTREIKTLRRPRRDQATGTNVLSTP